MNELVASNGKTLYTSRKVDGLKSVVDAYGSIAKSLEGGSTSLFMDAINFLIQYVDEFKDRAVMSNFHLGETKENREFFFIQEGTEYQIIDGTLMERRVSAIGLFLVKLGMELGQRYNVDTYRRIEKLICKSLTPTLLKNLVGKGIPRQVELIGYGMMKFVFKQGDKVYKYYSNRSLTDHEELILEPYVMQVLHEQSNALFAKVHSYSDMVEVQDYVEGPRLDEVLSDDKVSDMQLRAHAVDVMHMIEHFVNLGISLHDLSALNIVYETSTSDLKLIDSDAVLTDSVNYKSTIKEAFVDSISHLLHGRTFGAYLMSLLQSSGTWEQLSDGVSNPDNLISRTEFISRFSLTEYR